MSFCKLRSPGSRRIAAGAARSIPAMVFMSIPAEAVSRPEVAGAGGGERHGREGSGGGVDEKPTMGHSDWLRPFMAVGPCSACPLTGVSPESTMRLNDRAIGEFCPRVLTGAGRGKLAGGNDEMLEVDPVNLHLSVGLRPVSWLEAFFAHQILVWAVFSVIGSVFAGIGLYFLATSAIEATAMRRVAMVGARAEGLSEGTERLSIKINRISQHRLLVSFEDANGSYHQARSLSGPVERFSYAPRGTPVAVLYDPADPDVAFLEREVTRAR